MTMTAQSLPFEQPASELRPRRRHKRTPERAVREASLDAYERIKKSRVKIYRPILALLAKQPPAPAMCLTAREILRALKASGALGPEAERNQVSPRLTELLEAGCVEQPDYLKRLPGEAAAGVWRLTTKGGELLQEVSFK